jgi:hypothetical protein
MDEAQGGHLKKMSSGSLQGQGRSLTPVRSCRPATALASVDHGRRMGGRGGQGSGGDRRHGDGGHHSPRVDCCGRGGGHRARVKHRQEASGEGGFGQGGAGRERH